MMLSQTQISIRTQQRCVILLLLLLLNPLQTQCTLCMIHDYQITVYCTHGNNVFNMNKLRKIYKCW